MGNTNKEFPLPVYIQNLDTRNLGDNLLYYSYHTKFLLSLIRQNADKESQQFISAYNGFRGELFENIVYELLLRYTLENNDITQFVLKGPHQNLSNKENHKFGLIMDKSKQIVYKAGYKDVSEYDAMFFTKDSVVYVESTIVQSTIGLRKRLRKKTALLSLLFPNLKVKALIILSEGATGLNRFPDNCTVWVTKKLDPEPVLNLIAKKNEHQKQKFISFKDKRLIEAHSIKVNFFKYYDTLGWILRKSIDNEAKKFNESFFKSKNTLRYMDIYSKVYIGYVTKIQFQNVLDRFNSDEIELEKIIDDKIHVTIEKQDEGSFDLIYYYKTGSKKLFKVELVKKDIKLTQKDPKGFTMSETKFMIHSYKNNHNLNIKLVKYIANTIKKWNFK
ncbi:MAG TPA: hypothetical protein ENK66_09155 [Arcobacter sp.]|nr:hypothetical protein [Arcobacter sp.]